MHTHTQIYGEESCNYRKLFFIFFLFVSPKNLALITTIWLSFAMHEWKMVAVH